MTSEDKKIDPAKAGRRSLVAAQEAAAVARGSHDSRASAERAVLVAVEFTGERRKLTLAARMARGAAAVATGSALEESAPPEPQRTTDLDFEASLEEFQELARSAGAKVAATLIQRRPRPDPATLVGQGKLEEIEGVIASTGADLVLFDHNLTPSQLRNLEGKLPCRVIDRTQLILDIFARHARTREGQLQVELAQLEYQLPQLAGRGKFMSQLGGGIGTRGPGETQRETDRRKINLRIDHVKGQLESVRRIRDTDGSSGEPRSFGIEETGTGPSAGGHRCRAGGGPADRETVSAAAVGGSCAGGAGGWSDCRREAVRGQPGVCHSTRASLVTESVSAVLGGFLARAAPNGDDCASNEVDQLI